MTIENLQTISNVFILIGAIVTAIGTFGHFYFGQQIEKDKTAKESEKIRNRFLIETEALIEPLKVQTEELKLFTNRLNEDKKSISLVVVHNLKGSLQSKYDYYQLSKAFEANSNDFYNLWQRIVLIETIINSIENEVPKYTHIVNIQKAIYGEKIRKIFTIRDLYASQVNSGKLNLIQNPFIAEFIEICGNHMKVAEEYKLLFGKESLINPLDKICKKYFTQDSRVSEITPHVLECFNSYKLIEEGHQRIIEFNENMIQQLSKLIDEIEDHLRKLKK
ncbi:hypothetical protein QQ008_24545 [Fulvivirgaceae bacterium BMA10]|uniref:Uncharacterized protein n=1 Tax=Splendidivirga corallicola TaxID=3051826 RepID=A0ABT8KWQ5_9BACT|nr:hypothetical protein [Fulvivirgaceae bacterium BMA10]